MTTNGRASLEGALLAPDGLDHVQALATPFVWAFSDDAYRMKLEGNKRVGALCGTMAVGVGLGLFYVTGGTKNARAKRENWSIITFGKIMPFHAYQSEREKSSRDNIYQIMTDNF